MVSTHELWSLVDEITDLTVLQKSVLIALVRFSSPENDYCSWRSYSTLAKVTCASRRGVVSAVSQLSEQGLITLEKRKRTASKNYSNIYRLNIEEMISRVAKLQGGELSAPTDDLSSELSAPTVHTSSERSSKSSELSALPDDLSSEQTSPPEEEITQGGELTSLEGCTQFTKVVNSLHQGSELSAPKYDLNKNLNKKRIGSLGESENSLLAQRPNDFVFDMSETDVLNFWTYIKGFVERTYKHKLSPVPNETDRDAIRWVIDQFGVDAHAKEDCLNFCEFAHKELGEPENVFNPIWDIYVKASSDYAEKSKLYDKYF